MGISASQKAAVHHAERSDERIGEHVVRNFKRDPVITPRDHADFAALLSSH
jgi:hypothetical protein